MTLTSSYINCHFLKTYVFQETLIELSTVDVSFGTSCKHATSPITRFSNVSFDWSVEKCHCQINVDVSFGTSCKHATSPITRFSNVSFDWSVEKCHCQINVVGRYVLISKMNFYLFPRCSF